MKSNRFIILDRDGVINSDSPDYIKTPDEWIAIDDSIKAIAQLSEMGYQVIVMTNQSGLARNYYTPETLARIHEKMLQQVRAAKGNILDIFYCPHGPDDQCVCRKPATGMYDLIKEKYPLIDFNETYSVGDSLRDLQAAQKSGCLPALVKTGNGLKTLEKISTDRTLTDYLSVPIFNNLFTFSEFLRQK